jgi:lipopolysaccharide transport system ATP-binding protein
MLALKAENISKQYRLGQVGTGTLSHDLNRFWYRVRGKEDPYLKIGEENDRTTKGESEYVWSLRDINFEIERGDAVGIVGRNGAGKSTLLKLLSKITKPTTGKIYLNGRIASLLEVGTGFHPEMTGRENIYLNGAILGMTRQEISRKFDEIVDFSGVERYIDTPVKRYSSGMYVRLAFAVAAHLESEILIVDEVLAVGDAEFQNKCLGKMNTVTRSEGRTVIFVSHNLTAVKDLCKSGILLDKGKMIYTGKMEETIIQYQKTRERSSNYSHYGDIQHAYGNENIRIREFSVQPTRGKIIDINSGIHVKIKFFNYTPNINLDVTFELRTYEELAVFHVPALITTNNDSKVREYEVEYEIPPYFLNAGNYYFRLSFGINQVDPLLWWDHAIAFEVQNVKLGVISDVFAGVVRPRFDFKIT